MRRFRAYDLELAPGDFTDPKLLVAKLKGWQKSGGQPRKRLSHLALVAVMFLPAQGYWSLLAFMSARKLDEYEKSLPALPSTTH